MVVRHRLRGCGDLSGGGDGVHLVVVGKERELLKERVLYDETHGDQGERDKGRGYPCAIREHTGEVYVFCGESGIGKSRTCFQSRE